MLHLTGLDLAKELLNLQPSLPILRCTGFSENMTAEQGRNLGIRRFLMKPIVMRELTMVIREVVGRTK